MKKLLVCMLTLIAASAAFAQSGKDITVVSRESGSGTRGAFIELVGVEVSDSSGKKVDQTTKEAIIANKTDVAITTVAGNPYAIGYISLGSLNSTVKAVNVDGVTPSVENIKKGSYKIARPFNIAVSKKASPASQDFINFILSKEGQVVVAKGYIAVNETAPAFASTKPSGRLTVAGSSSVTPVMEKLQEAYNKINPALKIEVQQSDSSTGMQAAINGTCDIGMASRELKPKELEALKPITIAIDGIAVIVNKDNSISDLSKEEIKNIFTGKRTKW